jgi:hypothetical protein
MRSMVPLKNQVTPPSWNYPQNVRGNLPIQRPPGDLSTTRSTVAQPTSQISDKTANGAPALVPEVDPTPINHENARQQATTHPTSGDIGPASTENRPRFPALDQEGAFPQGPESNQEGDILTKSPTRQLPTTFPVSYPTQLITSAPRPSTNPSSTPIVSPKVPTPGIRQSNIRSDSNKINPIGIKPVNPYSDIIAAAPTRNSQPVGTQPPTNFNTTKSGREVKPNSKYEYFIHHNSTEAYAVNLKKLLQIEDRKDAIRAAINDERSIISWLLE